MCSADTSIRNVAAVSPDVASNTINTTLFCDSLRSSPSQGFDIYKTAKDIKWSLGISKQVRSGEERSDELREYVCGTLPSNADTFVLTRPPSLRLTSLVAEKSQDQ